MRKAKKKQILSILLSILTAFSIMPVNCMEAKADTVREMEEVPEGYQPIYNIEDLYGIRNDLNGNYILMNDIDMSADTAQGGDYDCGTGWDSIETFSGILDGNGHRISGMHIFGEFNLDEYGSGNLGLFEELCGATIKNLGIVDSDINMTLLKTEYNGRHIGNLAGDTLESYIENCYTSGNIQVQEKGEASSKALYAYIGGVTGVTEDTSILNCYNTCNIDCSVEGDSIYVGGICGATGTSSNFKMDVLQCYNVGMLSGTQTGGICGHYSGRFQNCKYLRGTAPQGIAGQTDSAERCTSLSEAQMKSQGVFTGYDFAETWEIDPYCSYAYPQLRNNRMVRVSSIHLTASPEKTVYFQGDPLNLNGAQLEITYEDGIKTTIPVTLSMLSGQDMNCIGVQAVTVSYGGIETSFDIEVKEIPVTEIKLPENLSLYRSREKKLDLTILPENASNKFVTWESDHPEIASVNSDGTVKGMQRGTAVITAASSNGLKASCTITVLVPAVSVNISQSSISMKAGEQFLLAAQVSPLESTDAVQWKSANPAIAQVNNGTVEGKGAGTTTVTAYTESGAEASCAVTVQVPAKSVSISPNSVTLKVGESCALAAQTIPSESTDAIQWKSANPEVAEVNGGTVIGKKAGTTTVTAYTESGAEASCAVTVQVPAESVNISQNSVTLKVGESCALAAQTIPSESTDAIQWKSANPEVAEVNGGTVTGKKAGTTTVTAYTESGAEASCAVTVQDAKKSKEEETIKKTAATKAKIKSAKNVKGKKIKLKLSGGSKCDGYKIQYSLKKNFKGAKTVTSKSGTATLKRLKLKKNYYIRARVYKKISGKTYYGKWSGRKSVKVKK